MVRCTIADEGDPDANGEALGVSQSVPRSAMDLS